MSEGSKNSNEAKAKFREALEKKNQSNFKRKDNIKSGFKVSGGQSIGSTPKIFRRKSGSA